MHTCYRESKTGFRGGLNDGMAARGAAGEVAFQMDQHVRILVVEHSPVYRVFLSKIIRELDGFELTGIASHDKMAFYMLGNKRINLVLLDANIPEAGGPLTVKAIREHFPNVEVMILHEDLAINPVFYSLEVAGFIRLTRNLDALRANVIQSLNQAYSLLQGKPGAPATGRQLSDLREYMASRRTGGHSAVQVMQTSFEAVVIGASTGGADALACIIPQLPSDLGVPVLVAHQHTAAGQVTSLVRALGRTARLQVKEAEPDEPVQPNTVYLSPENRHMAVKKLGQDRQGIRINLSEDRSENGCQPSVNLLVRSAAQVYGKNVLAVMLTGKGDDGCQGVSELKAEGGYCLTQSQRSCLVYDMPGAIAERGLSDETVDLDLMALRIQSLVTAKKA